MKLLVGALKSFLMLIFMILIIVGKSLRSGHYTTKGRYGKEGASNGDESGHTLPKEGGGEELALGMELYPRGSSLPDCSHACGPCSPCKRVMVSFKCSVA